MLPLHLQIVRSHPLVIACFMLLSGAVAVSGCDSASSSGAESALKNDVRRLRVPTELLVEVIRLTATLGA